MKSCVRKMVLWLLLVSMLMSAFTLDSYALQEGVMSSELQHEERVRSVFEAKIVESTLEEEVLNDCVEISSLKYAYDFAGNNYTIAELSPIGYMVLNESTGVFTEYSYSSISPYADYDENLFYCGPTFYYEKEENGEFIHLIDDESIEGDNVQLYADSCNFYYSQLVSMSDYLVVSYLNGNYPNQDFLEVEMEVMNSEIMSTSIVSVPNSSFFYDMNECGYASGGICGYIAFGLLLAYKDKYTTTNYLDDKYWADSSHSNLVEGNSSIAKYLRNMYGSKDATVSTDIKNVCKSYCSDRGITPSYSSLWTPFFSADTIAGHINDGNPVILFGNLENPKDSSSNINHAVTVYKYKHNNVTSGATYLTAHFGWDGYESVTVSGTFGSMFVLK